MKPASPALVNVLLAKSIIETILIGALAVASFITAWPPTFHGWGEVAGNRISGWAVNDANPFERVEVQLYVDGQLVNSTLANQSRPDVAAAGWSKDEWHGYSFSLPPLATGKHEARIFALHASGNDARKSLQLLGDPIPFVV